MVISLSYFLLFLTLICFGSWSNIRVYTCLQGANFSLFYIVGQVIISALFFSLYSIFLFDSQSIKQGLTVHTIAFGLSSGFSSALADFLVACSCARISPTISFPAYAGVGLITGSTLNLVIETKVPINLIYFCFGIFFAMVAIFLISFSGKYRTKSTGQYPDPTGTNNQQQIQVDLDNYHILYFNHETICLKGSTSIEQKLEYEGENFGSNKFNSFIWIMLSLFAGTITGLWSPLLALSTSPNQNVIQIALLFYSGQLASVPVIILLFTQVIARMDDERKGIFFQDFLSVTIHCSRQDKLISVVCGLLVGLGYSLYFIFFRVISSSISFAVAACCPLVSLFIAVFLKRELVHAPFVKVALVTGTALSFIIAISFLLTAREV